MLALFIMNFIKQLFWKKEEDYGRGEYCEGSARFEEESSEEEELVKPEKKTRGRKRGRPKLDYQRRHLKQSTPQRDEEESLQNLSDYENDSFFLSSQESVTCENAGNCAFCKDGGGGLWEQPVGPFSRVGSPQTKYIHELCAQWAPDLQQYSECSSFIPAPKKFNVHLFKALRRSASLKCALCKRKGAAIGCMDNSCRHTYHLNCALKDDATFLSVKNVLQQGKIHPHLRVVFCRDCCPLRLSSGSKPSRPLNLARLIRNQDIGSEELCDIYGMFNIVEKIVDERQTKNGKELEVVFFGSKKSLWIQEDNFPPRIVSLYSKQSQKNDSEPSGESSSGESEEDQCSICQKLSSPKKNPIVYCDGKDCGVKVHKECYKISKIPKGEWYCNRCAANAPSTVRCRICGGAAKNQAMTCETGDWTHVLCLRKTDGVCSKRSASPAKKAKTMARLTPRDRKDVWEIILREESNAKCPICKINNIKKEGSFQCAHIDANAKGCGDTAQDEIWNMVPSCIKCNLTCGTKNLIDFMDGSIMMRPQIKPLLFLKVKSIILCKMDTCPLSTKQILGYGNLKDVVKAIFNPKNMPHISRLLELSSNEHHNLFVNHEEQAPSHFYRKFSS